MEEDEEGLSEEDEGVEAEVGGWVGRVCVVLHCLQQCFPASGMGGCTGDWCYSLYDAEIKQCGLSTSYPCIWGCAACVQHIHCATCRRGASTAAHKWNPCAGKAVHVHAS